MSELFEKSENSDGFKVASVTQLSLERANVVLVDVREPDEFKGELGHLKGARLVPLATVGEAAAAWSKSDEYLMICRSGNRSGKAAALLAQMGFKKVINLAGGMNAVSAARLSVERG